MPKIEVGDRVLLEVQGPEVYECTIQRKSADTLEITNIFCRNTLSDYNGSLTFFRNEVVAISRLATVTKSEEQIQETGSVELSKTIDLDPDEFSRLKQMTLDAVFINTVGKEFQDAVKMLWDRESVAVVGLGKDLKRGKSISLLLLADFKNIFIFDMHVLAHLRSLKKILESSYICKVLHGGAALSSLLCHKYGVEMNNVFDTQIVDTMISAKGQEQRNVSECLTHHFNFPPSLLSAALDDTPKNVWDDRPVIKMNRIKAAQLVVYLLTLKDRLMSHILQPYTAKISEEYVQKKSESQMSLT